MSVALSLFLHGPISMTKVRNAASMAGLCCGRQPGCVGCRGTLQDALLANMRALGIRADSFLWRYVIQQHARDGAPYSSLPPRP